MSLTFSSSFASLCPSVATTSTSGSVYTLGEMIPSSKLFGKGISGSTGKKRPLLCSKLNKSAVFLSLPPWGILSILDWKQKGNEWKRKNGNIGGNLCEKKHQENTKKIKVNPSNQIASYCGSISVWLGLVLLHISHCRTTINHYHVRDYQFSACVSARYVSAGLLCLRGSTSVFFFLPLIMLWTEAAVSSRLAQPPSHTEGLQYWSDVLRMLFVWPLTLPQPCVAPFSERTWNIVFAKINITAVRLFHIRSNLLQTGCDTCSLSKLEIFSQALYDTDRGNTSFFTGDGSCRGL